MGPKDIATKSGETHARMHGTELYHHANFHAHRSEMSAPWQNIHIFPYRGLPWGLISDVTHIWKTLVEPMLRTM